ncbi:4-alpha-glucanotransferase [Roseimicrobium gellanilyticum]|uniref:4-alpha-glucanotransferase n=1 Tax=Roseimicrobium gellanilyticum TaxID=748857 RepID=A0A366HKG8_9BACT|nr:4-alpha-glucanotransferase [Roseimicrobium gellanilyticum]RBP42519.1 4-alpha-glucanotransferase [Roseimicrobium gellanilyticum]
MLSIPRCSGILLHPTSLPGRFGIGEIGRGAELWLEALHRMGQRAWQVLPLGPTGYGNSPYQSLSSYAGNPLLISLDSLVKDGVVRPSDLAVLPEFPDDHVDFGAVLEIRTAFLKNAAHKFIKQCSASPLLQRAFETFCQRESEWLDDWSMFIALKGEYDLRPWTEWPKGIALRDEVAMAEVMAGLEEEIEAAKVLQFFFHRQWNKLRLRAKELDISIIGDIPIFAAHDSADVWANRGLFHLDEHGNPTVVAGVPPDYFAATGQRWGNPLYDWEKHQKTNFAWWKSRLRKTLSLVDIVRIDHFRGFAAYWEIPASEATAVNGQWVEAPGDALFEAFKEDLGEVPIIAEDLGLITPDVVALRDRHELPGMRVMQFAFGADALAEDYIPENYPDNSVAYTGTHDNDTMVGYFNSGEDEHTTRTAEMVEKERANILGYTKTDGTQIHWDFIEHVWASKARLAICPLQDVLGLGSEARMNIPGKSGEFWTWRFEWKDLTTDLEWRLKRVTLRHGRAANVG